MCAEQNHSREIKLLEHPFPVKKLLVFMGRHLIKFFLNLYLIPYSCTDFLQSDFFWSLYEWVK